MSTFSTTTAASIASSHPALGVSADAVLGPALPDQIKGDVLNASVRFADLGCGATAGSRCVARRDASVVVDRLSGVPVQAANPPPLDLYGLTMSPSATAEPREHSRRRHGRWCTYRSGVVVDLDGLTDGCVAKLIHRVGLAVGQLRRAWRRPAGTSLVEPEFFRFPASGSGMVNNPRPAAEWSPPPGVVGSYLLAAEEADPAWVQWSATASPFRWERLNLLEPRPALLKGEAGDDGKCDEDPAHGGKPLGKRSGVRHKRQ